MTSRHRSPLRRGRVISAPASIGLDIGSMSVRAAAVSQTKGRPTLDGFGNVPLPHGATSGGVLADERAVTGAIKSLWAEQGFKSKSVRLAVSHQQVVVREVEIANLPDKEMRQALPHLARDLVALAIDQAILDFHPLEKAEKKDTVRGLLVAAPKEPVVGTVRAVERAGLRVEKVDLACFAALRAIASPTAGAEAIIDVGATSTRLIIHRDGVPHIVRTIARGGNDITDLLCTRLAITRDEAEALKCRFGATEDPSGVDHEHVEVVTDALRPTISEVRNSLTFYVNGGPDRTVDRLTLVGRGSLLPGLAGQLHRATNLPVIDGDPLRYVGTAQHRNRRDDLGEFRTAAAVSVGLSLGAA